MKTTKINLLMFLIIEFSVTHGLARLLFWILIVGLLSYWFSEWYNARSAKKRPKFLSDEKQAEYHIDDIAEALGEKKSAKKAKGQKSVKTSIH